MRLLKGHVALLQLMRQLSTVKLRKKFTQQRRPHVGLRPQTPQYFETNNI